MRIKLLANGMLKGQSLQMCQDYWRPYNPHQYSTGLLEWHVRKICQKYHVTFEELFSSLLQMKAYDSTICCVNCGKMYELYNPCDLPNPIDFMDWQCDDCQTFQNRGCINLQGFLLSFEPDDGVPF